MAKRDSDGCLWFTLIMITLLIVFWPAAIVIGIVALVGKADEKSDDYTRAALRRQERQQRVDALRRQDRQQRVDNMVCRKLEKENKRLATVAKFSRLGQSLDLMNEKLVFLEVEHKETVVCKTKVEYDNFSPKSHFATNFFEFSEIVAGLQKNAQKNDEIHREYKKSFLACDDFTPVEEIKRIRRRGMSIKKFNELEKKLFNKKIQAPPCSKIAITIAVVYLSMQKHIVIDGFALKSLLKEIQDDREYNFVCKNSFIYNELVALNKKYVFNHIAIPRFSIKCNSYKEFQKFELRKYVSEYLKKEQEETNCVRGLETLYNQACENQTLYEEYQNSYDELPQYFRSIVEIEALENSPIEAEKFRTIENKIYAQLKLEEPIMDFSIAYEIEYTSPAGRNYYCKDEYVNKAYLGKILKEVESEKLWKKAFEEHKEYERQKKARERAEINDIKRLKEKLERKELELAQREREFQQATQGHIYAGGDSLAYIKEERPNIETAKQPLSDWEKMKLLKTAYDNGEITYEEYSEKREQLL